MFFKNLTRGVAFTGLVLASSLASAQLVTLEFNDGDSLSGWGTDRAAPAGFEIVGNELVMSIDGASSTGGGSFYDTQGMKLDIGKSNYLSVDMFVSSDWSGSQRYAGIWGVGYDAADAISSYPIMEFQGAGAVDVANPAGINSWDNLGWQSVSELFNFDAFNTLEFFVNNGVLEYYLNGSLVHTDGASGTTYLGEVILNAKNVGASYDVRYDNLTYGVVPEPGIMALFGLGLVSLVAMRRRQA